MIPTDAKGREIKVGATVHHRELTRALTWEVSAIVEDEGVTHLLLDQGSRFFGPFSDLELVVGPSPTDDQPSTEATDR